MDIPTNFELYEPTDSNRAFLRDVKKAYINKLQKEDQSFGQSFVFTQFFQLSLEAIFI